jgi:tetratricopeptide (TPR) repeat protein
VTMNLNEIEVGVELMLRAVREYESIGDLPHALANRTNIAYAQTISGAPEQALETAVAGLQSALRMNDPYVTAGLAAAAGEAAVFTGDWEDAERYLDLSLQQEEEYFRSWALTALGVLRAKQERHADAVHLLDAAAQEAQRIEDPHGEAYALHPLAISQHVLGDVEGARASITRAHELYTRLGMAKETSATAEFINGLPEPAPEPEPSQD